jgi:hypothetical protein
VVGLFDGLRHRCTLTFQDRAKLNFVKTGAALMDTGIAVNGMTGDNASEIIWIERPPRDDSRGK